MKTWLLMCWPMRKLGQIGMRIRAAQTDYIFREIEREHGCADLTENDY